MLLLQPGLELLEILAGAGVAEQAAGDLLVIRDRRRVGAEILLADGLDPLPRRCGGAEDLAGEREGFAKLLASGRSHDKADPLPGLLLGLGAFTELGPDLGGQRPDRLDLRLLHPGGLRVAAGQRDDGLCLAAADGAGLDGGAQQRSLGEVAGEPGQLLGGAAGEAEPLARIVAETGEAEAQQAIADREGGEAGADGEIEPAAAASHPDQQAVEEEGGLVAHHRLALAGLHRLERPGDAGERFEVGICRRWERIAHAHHR